MRLWTAVNEAVTTGLPATFIISAVLTCANCTFTPSAQLYPDTPISIFCWCFAGGILYDIIKGLGKRRS